MISRNKRGIRRASTRVRLAVAAAVLVGGGAAGVVAVAASHSGAVAAQSAGYTTHTLSEHAGAVVGDERLEQVAEQVAQPRWRR